MVISEASLSEQDMKFTAKNNKPWWKNQTIFFDIQRKLRKVIETLHLSQRRNLDPVKNACQGACMKICSLSTDIFDITEMFSSFCRSITKPFSAAKKIETRAV
jgi:hypothetical protein